MKIRNLFSKPIDRHIEGVIKADDEAQLANEVEEYIVTNEIAQRLQHFFEAYNENSSASGVWISGFFGSGKSHLLKILSLVLENRQVDGVKAGDEFCSKIDDAFLKAEVGKAIKTPSRSILFNIDQKSDIISKQDTDAILSVFLKVFNEMQGFYPKQPYIAQFERDLSRKGQFDQFRAEFEEEAGESWESGRETAHGLDADPFAKAYSKVVGTTEEEGLKVLDRYHDTYRLDIEGFAAMVKDYIDTQEPGFRLNFFVDEVGQYIADNSKLMVNLQTIAESLSTKCQGRSWILVTSQEDMSTVVGEMAKIHTSNDFSKIQDRFKTRLPLTSKDVSEVIQKRLLSKDVGNAQVAKDLTDLYAHEKANFRTLFEFGDGSRNYKTYADEDEFTDSYPFIPYQFDLFQAAINGLSRNNAFTGKHASVGERSMLGVFQEVAKKIADKAFGQLATFDLMYEGIRSVIKSEHQRAIINAERQIGNPLAIRVLKSLFLVKYLKEFKSTSRNISILSIDAFDSDLAQHEKDVREALNLLEQNTFVQRTGEVFEFLTNEEKDIENEIKATEVDDSAINTLAAQLIFDDIIRDTKIRHEDNHQDYSFSRKLDGSTFGREHELAINIVSPFNELHGDEAALISHSMSKPEALLLLDSDDRLLSDLHTYAKTDKYIRQNSKSTQADSRHRVLYEKGQQNIQRKAAIKQRLEALLARAKAVVNGSEITGLGSEPRGRVIQTFHGLVRYAYPNLKMLRVSFGEDSTRRILADTGDDLFRHDDETLTEGETEILTHIRRRQTQGEKPTVQSILQEFGKRPYGWYSHAILSNIAKLFMRGKVELSADSNILDKASALDALSNSRQFTNTIVRQQEEFDSKAIHQLKKFHSEFFDESNTATEAKDVALRFQEKLKSLVAQLEEVRQRTQTFPFVGDLDSAVELLHPWCSKSYTLFLSGISDIQDEWLDTKEDVIDPIYVFIHGPQGKVYQELQTYFREQRANLSDIDSDESAKLQDFLVSAKPYRGKALQEAKARKEALAKKVDAALSEAKKDASGKIRTMVANIETLDGFVALSKSEKSKLFRPSNDTLEEVQDSGLLAVVRDKLARYSNDGYQRQLSEFNEIVANKAKAEGVEEEAAKYISKQSIQISFEKNTIETEGDLEAYLDAVRTAYSSALKENKKINLL